MAKGSKKPGALPNAVPASARTPGRRSISFMDCCRSPRVSGPAAKATSVAPVLADVIAGLGAPSREIATSSRPPDRARDSPAIAREYLHISDRLAVLAAQEIDA